MSSTDTDKKLRKLRLTLTAAVAAIAALGVGFLAIVATLVDAELRSGEDDAFRQGLASRLAALIYPNDDSGKWMTEGVADDAANSTADAVIVVTSGGSVLYQRGTVDGYSELHKRAVEDEHEVGVQGEVSVNGVPTAASGAPYWDFDTIEGAVIVALNADNSVAHLQLRFQVWTTAGLFTLIAAVAAWLIAGLFVKPVAAALKREERFLATAAHDIRTPLSRIRALAESAQQSSRDSRSDNSSVQLADDLRRLVASTVHASDIANDLLLAGRIDANQLQLRQVEVRLDLLVADFERTVPTLAVEVDEPVTVKGDSLLLRHAIGNILSNAEQHGRIDDKAPLIVASVNLDRAMAIIRITDNGRGLNGVDPVTMFRRHANGQSGSGLGLWIARSVLEEHGGTIEASDRPDNAGAQFVLRMPALVSHKLSKGAPDTTTAYLSAAHSA